MDLKTYLSTKDLTDVSFAGNIGVSSEAVRRYREGHRIPKPAIMRRIITATDGKVTPNDFLVAPDPEPEPEAAASEKAA